MKMAGMLLLLLGCGMAGQYAAGRLSRRRQYWQQLQRGIMALISEINCGLLPLPRALMNSGRQAGGEMGAFLRDIGEQLTLGGEAEEVWQYHAGQLCEQLALSSADRELLYNIALGLGQMDKKEQLKRLEHYERQIESLEQAAADECGKMMKVYRMLGWGGGFMLIILLI